MDTTTTSQFVRAVAHKVCIRDILSGTIRESEEGSGTFLLIASGEKIRRINLIAIVVGIEEQGSITNVVCDDGEGTIIVRFFEEHKSLKKISVGDAVLIVGKVRSYNGEKYIAPEICKKTDPAWLKVRALSLPKEEVLKKVEEQQEAPSLEQPQEIVIEQEEPDKKDVESKKPTAFLLPMQKLSKLIDELDSGDGVAIEDVIEQSPLEKTEELIEKMLKEGNIFQNAPGKIKVL